MKQIFFKIVSSIISGLIVNLIWNTEVGGKVMDWAWQNIFWHYLFVWIGLVGGGFWVLYVELRDKYRSVVSDIKEIKVSMEKLQQWEGEPSVEVFREWLDQHKTYWPLVRRSFDDRVLAILEWKGIGK